MRTNAYVDFADAARKHRRISYAWRGMERIHIMDLEAAINHWRGRCASGPDFALSTPVRDLAQVYAQMIGQRATWVAVQALPDAALQAWLTWYDTQPDTPCIAICSTSQGDNLCKGCGRSFEEVQQWLGLSPYAKRAVWLRISEEGSALRFTRYAERAAEKVRANVQPL